MEISEIEIIVKKAVQEAYPRDWLNKEQVCSEFGIKPTTLYGLVNDVKDPLPYSSLGSKKKLFARADINDYLNRRKRNV